MMGKKIILYMRKGCKRKTEEQCMNKRGNIVLKGNDYDSWYDYGIKDPIISDITQKPIHIYFCAVCLVVKSYALLRCFFREFVQVGSPQDEYYFETLSKMIVLLF